MKYFSRTIFQNSLLEAISTRLAVKIRYFTVRIGGLTYYFQGISADIVSYELPECLEEVWQMHRIMLVPLDGSELAEVVLPYAEEIAVRLGLDIDFPVFCCDLPSRVLKTLPLFVSPLYKGGFRGIPRFKMSLNLPL